VLVELDSFRDGLLSLKGFGVKRVLFCRSVDGYGIPLVTERLLDAHIQPNGAKGKAAAKIQNLEPRLAGLPAEAGRLHSRLHADAQETELGA
jgi:hypothetical protein